MKTCKLPGLSVYHESKIKTKEKWTTKSYRLKKKSFSRPESDVQIFQEVVLESLKIEKE